MRFRPPPGDWRSPPSYPGYLVSRDGRVFGRRGWVLSSRQDENGYWVVSIQVDGISRPVGVHRLLCDAFYGPPPSPLHEAAHNDGSRANNDLGNLSWKTPKENQADRKKHGTDCTRDRHPLTTLTTEKVADVLARYRANRRPGGRVPLGFRQSLAAELGVKPTVISEIVSGRTWSGVGELCRRP